MSQASRPLEPYIITGVKGGKSGIHPRLEINDLEKNYPEQFTLFILAWKQLQSPSHQLATQLEKQAGIHGLPYMQWSGDPGSQVESTWFTELQGGYCHHKAITFPTWHRSMLLLFEQSISESALEIAQAFGHQHGEEEGQRWINAAKQLRLPYWDWTSAETGSHGLPEIFSQKRLGLKMPGKEESKICDNVLAFHSFNGPRPPGFQNECRRVKIIPENPEEVKLNIGFYKGWDRTYRWPQPRLDEPKEDIEGLNNLFKGEGVYSWKSIRLGVADLFKFRHGIEPKLHANVWDKFSNTGFQSAPRSEGKVVQSEHEWLRIGSLEQPHNSIHLLIGGNNGHMVDPDYAGFDPIFWLHHCNVDRIFAFWEHIYPEYWMGEDGYMSENGVHRKDFILPGKVFGDPRINSPIKGSSGLLPFRKEEKAYWSSKDTRMFSPDAVPQYYTYPPIDGVALGTKATLPESERQRAVLQKHFGYNPAESQQSAISLTEQNELFSEFSAEASEGYRKVNNYREFSIIIEATADTFQGSCTIEVLCNTSEGEEHVGAVAIFERSSSTRCGACQQRRATGQMTYNVIHVPHGIAVKIARQYEATGPIVEGFKQALRARVTTPVGHVVAEMTSQSRSSSVSLAQGNIPVLSLVSSSIQVPQSHESDFGFCGHQGDVPDLPYESYDHQYHGTLSGHWVITSH